MERLKSYIAFWIVSLVWGTTYLAITIGVRVLPPFLLGGIRWISAGSILLLYFKIKGHNFPTISELKNIAISAAILIGGANSLLIWAVKEVPSGLTALIFATFPFWMAGMGAILPHGEKLNNRKTIGIAIGFIGLIVLFQSDLKYFFNKEYLFGILMIFLAAIAWAGGTLFSKYRVQGSGSMMNTAMQMLIGGLIQSILGIFTGEVGDFTFSIQGIIAITYLIIFGSIVGFVAYAYALKKLPPSTFSMYVFINLVIAILLGWIVLNERMDLNIIIATGLILFGVAIVMRDNKSDAEMSLSNQLDSKGGFWNHDREIREPLSKVNI